MGIAVVKGAVGVDVVFVAIEDVVVTKVGVVDVDCGDVWTIWTTVLSGLPARVSVGKTVLWQGNVVAPHDVVITGVTKAVLLAVLDAPDATLQTGARAPVLSPPVES